MCLLGGAAVSLACGCWWFETEAQLQHIYDQSEEAFVGQAIAAIAPHEPGRNRRFLGYDVLLRVTSRKKGLVRRDTVLVLQEESNCARPFVKDDTVNVFAHVIRHVQPLLQPGQEHYSYFDEQRQSFYRSGGAAVVKRDQQWAGRFPAITTNQCISFTNRHRLVPAFFRAKQDQ
ncbi:hypothetical protein GCM10028824_41970 [Hymenobacter segetis]